MKADVEEAEEALKVLADSKYDTPTMLAASAHAFQESTLILSGAAQRLSHDLKIVQEMAAICESASALNRRIARLVVRIEEESKP